MLFNEPKLLKSTERYDIKALNLGFSALQRAEIAEMQPSRLTSPTRPQSVSVLFNEPKLLKCVVYYARSRSSEVSVLFNEPKLLKS